MYSSSIEIFYPNDVHVNFKVSRLTASWGDIQEVYKGNLDIPSGKLEYGKSYNLQIQTPGMLKLDSEKVGSIEFIAQEDGSIRVVLRCDKGYIQISELDWTLNGEYTGTTYTHLSKTLRCGSGDFVEAVFSNPIAVKPTTPESDCSRVIEEKEKLVREIRGLKRERDSNDNQLDQEMKKIGERCKEIQKEADEKEAQASQKEQEAKNAEQKAEECMNDESAKKALEEAKQKLEDFKLKDFIEKHIDQYDGITINAEEAATRGYRNSRRPYVANAGSVRVYYRGKDEEEVLDELVKQAREEALQLKKAVDMAKANLGNHRTECERKRETAKMLRQQAEDAWKEMGVMKEELNQCKEKLNQLEEEILEKAGEKFKNLDEKLKINMNYLKKLLSRRRECIDCCEIKQLLSETVDELEKREGICENLQKEADEKEAQASQKEQEAKDSEQKAEDCMNDESAKKAFEEAKAEEDVESFERDCSKIQEKAKWNRKEAENARKEAENAKKMVDQCTNALDMLREQIDFFEKTFNECVRDLTECRNEIKAFNMQIREKRKELGNCKGILEKELEKLEDERNRAQGLVKKYPHADFKYIHDMLDAGISKYRNCLNELENISQPQLLELESGDCGVLEECKAKLESIKQDHSIFEAVLKQCQMCSANVADEILSLKKSMDKELNKVLEEEKKKEEHEKIEDLKRKRQQIKKLIRQTENGSEEAMEKLIVETGLEAFSKLGEEYTLSVGVIKGILKIAGMPDCKCKILEALRVLLKPGRKDIVDVLASEYLRVWKECTGVPTMSSVQAGHDKIANMAKQIPDKKKKELVKIISEIITIECE